MNVSKRESNSFSCSKSFLGRSVEFFTHAGAKADPGLDLGIVGGARMLSRFDGLLALFLSTSGRLKVLEVELVVTGLARVDNIAKAF